MGNKSILILMLLTLQQTLFGQVSGNQVFSNSDNSYNYYNRNENSYKSGMLSKLSVTDSSFIIQAKLLKNVKADYYVAVFGLSNEAATVAESDARVNMRTTDFISGIKKMGITDADIYTDIITQYRVYDLKKSADQQVEEFLKGFELSKNVIVKYRKSNQLEQLLTLASKDSIYDLVKVDYITEDVSKIYDDLFQAASEIINKKKQLYLNLTSAAVLPNAQIYGENFASYYPIEMYKSYKAFSSNFYESYLWLYDKKKAVRKFTTYYYDKTDYSGFDKIINPVVLEPVIEFVLTLQVKYDMKK